MAISYTIGRIITNALKRANMENYTEYDISRTQLLALLHDATMILFAKIFNEDKSYYWTTDGLQLSADLNGIVDISNKNIATLNDLVLIEISFIYGKQIIIYQPSEYQTEKLFLSTTLKDDIIGCLESNLDVGNQITQRIILAKGINISHGYNELSLSLSYFRIPNKLIFKNDWQTTLDQKPDILDNRGELAIEILSQLLVSKRELKMVEGKND